MKKKALRKDLYVEIYRTLNRFLSIFLIVALGTAFFSGIRATDPDMRLSADRFYDDSNMRDIRVMGGLGLTQEDAQALAGVEGVLEVNPSYSYDVFWQLPDEQAAVKLMSLQEDMNRITVTEGRLPEKTGECLMDETMAQEYGISLGDTLQLRSGDDADIEDIVAHDSLEVVGLGTTSLYLSLERGTTSIGIGSLEGFLVVLPQEFTLESYTEIDLTVEGAEELLCYSDAYDDLVDSVEERIEAIEEERCAARYDEVKAEAAEAIADGRQEIADAKAELADARQELEDGETELADARQELADGETELADARREIADAEAEIADGKVQLADGWQQYQDGVYQCVEGMDTLKESQAQLESARQQLNAGYEQVNAAKAQLEQAKAQLDAQEAQIQGMEISDEEKAQMLAQVEAGRQELAGQEAALAQQEATLAATDQYLTEQEAAWEDGYWEIQNALEELKEAKATLEEKEQELADGEAELADAKKEVSDGEAELADARVELADGEAELADGWAEFNEESADAEEEIAEAEEELADAEEELASLEMPEWYILDRNTIETYVEYGQNAERIGAIGEVVPAIFFLVAALVSLTTMTRMVEEQRTQIGTKKALGYSRWDIARKYLYYAFLASILGSAVGCVVGQKVFPIVIIEAYKIMYNNLPDVVAPMHAGYSAMSTLLAVACTTGAAFLACYKEMRETPALLMRPVPPKSGKRVILEKLPFLWRRLSFTYKSTARNLFRYKKRFFMTIFGIGGCTALLLVGFGVQDSLEDIGNIEFGEIRNYTGSIMLEDDLTEEEIAAFTASLEEDGRVEEALRIEERSVDAGSSRAEGTKTSYLIVPYEGERLTDFITLRERAGHEPLELSSSGVVITEKLAKLLDVQEGEEIFLEDEDMQRYPVTVTGITENYFMHYIYMDRELYGELFQEEAQFRYIYTRNTSEEEKDERQFQADYMAVDGVASVTFQSGTNERVQDMLKSMDALIYVIVISAGLLAFVVLYNLNNINITERRRELATLRVLGFYNREVSAYVLRENVVLTVLGTGLGLGMGVALHRFIILTAEIDTMMFGRVIAPSSYLYAALFTLLFAGIVNGAMYVTLKKIDMVESLKSVE